MSKCHQKVIKLLEIYYAFKERSRDFQAPFEYVIGNMVKTTLAYSQSVVVICIIITMTFASHMY